MRKFILLFILLFVSTSLHLKSQNHVSFFEEHIDFALDTDYFIINGIYSFHNDTEKDINQQITFPFADKTATIDSIRIINLNTNSKIKFSRLENSVIFNFMLPSKDTVDINVFYRQRIAVENKYIITSTQSWGKPLERAVYTLTTDKNQKIKLFSYVPDSANSSHDKKIYFWRKDQFMPKLDFIVTLDDFARRSL
jgi:hypothetical protein